jgi:hypothetical protein
LGSLKYSYTLISVAIKTDKHSMSIREKEKIKPAGFG